MAVEALLTTTDHLDEEERLLALVHRFRAGEIYAFDALLEQLTPRMMPVISRFVADRDDADDALQEVSIQLYRALPRFRGECKISTFAYRISANVCMNLKQRNARYPRRFTDLSSAEDPDARAEKLFAGDLDATPERLLVIRAGQQMLREAVSSLNPKFREVFVLADLCEFSYEEIADITNAPVNTVRTRLKRAREAMRKKIFLHRELFAGGD
jgi:RNA polymerase sigma-70 factor (ECF subfamily)